MRCQGGERAKVIGRSGPRLTSETAATAVLDAAGAFSATVKRAGRYLVLLSLDDPDGSERRYGGHSAWVSVR